jgi:LmbE family N-acetylglucosaminyl deacetylase
MLSLQFPPGALQIICLGAHPDDVEIGCGGTLLTLAERGDIRPVVIVATGSAIRISEAATAASHFLPGTEVDMRVIGLRDGSLPAHWEEVKDALEDVASSTVPDLVFAPRPDDAHQDHRLIAKLVSTVWRDALVLHYEIPKWDGDLRQVNHYVQLDPKTARSKAKLLSKCFPSQVDRHWWDDETFLSLMRLRGLECRCRYAEGFMVTKALLSFNEGEAGL